MGESRHEFSLISNVFERMEWNRVGNILLRGNIVCEISVSDTYQDCNVKYITYWLKQKKVEEMFACGC